MRILLTPLLLLFLIFKPSAQCPVGIITQDVIDSIPDFYSNCKVWDGNLNLSHPSIHNLNPLEQLEKIKGSLTVGGTVSSLQGLHNVVSIGENFSSFETGLSISSSGLMNLEGLNGLKTISGITYIRAPNLQSTEGIGNLVSTDAKIDISYCHNMEYLTGFQKLQSTYELIINNNSQLREIYGFNKLHDVENFVFITGNPILEKVNDFNELRTAKGIFFDNNKNLKDINAFENVEELNRNVTIYNSAIENINSFNNLEYIGEYLYISFNDELKEVTGFQNIKNIGFGVSVSHNPQLSDCESFCIILDAVSGNTKYFSDNGQGCSSFADLESLCFKKTRINIRDVVLNLYTGSHTTKPISNCVVDIYENGSILTTAFPDEEGDIELNLDLFNEDNSYTFNFLSTESDIELIYEFSKDELKEVITIDYPVSLYSEIIELKDSLNFRMMRLDFFGGTFTWNYNLMAYDVTTIEESISFYRIIESEHSVSIETLKRLGLGMHAMNSYLNFATDFSFNLSKGLVDGMFNLYELFSLSTNPEKGLSNVVEKFKKDQVELGKINSSSHVASAMSATNYAITKTGFDFFKKYVIEPKLASFGSGETEQRYVQVIKAILEVFDRFLSGKGSINPYEVVKAAFWDLAYGAGAEKLVGDFYIGETELMPSLINLSSIEHNNSFEELVAETKNAIDVSEDLNRAVEFTTDFFASSASDLENLTGALEALAIELALYSGGTLSEISVGLYGIAKAFKATGIGLNAINVFAYGNRFINLPTELDGSIESLLRSNEGEVYPDGFLSEKLDSILAKIDFWNSLLLNFQSELRNGTNESMSNSYLIQNQYFETALEQELQFLHTLFWNFQKDRDIEEIQNVEVLKSSLLLTQLEIKRNFIHLNTLSILLDSTFLESRMDLISEVDSIIYLKDSLNASFSSDFNTFKNKRFEHLVVLSDFDYSTLFDSHNTPFDLNLEISNIGPETSPPFDILFDGNKNIEFEILNEEINAVGQIQENILDFNETKLVKLKINIVDSDSLGILNVRFKDARAIDRSIPFFFSNTIESEVSSIDQQNHEIGKDIVYPNPSAGLFHLKPEFHENIKEIKIFDVFGNALQYKYERGSSIYISQKNSKVVILKIRTNEGVYINKLILTSHN